jgi:hypothetical protein
MAAPQLPHLSLDDIPRQQLATVTTPSPSHRLHPYNRASSTAPSSVGSISSSTNFLADEPERSRLGDYDTDERRVINWTCSRIFMNSTKRGWLRINTNEEKNATCSYVREIITQGNAKFPSNPGMC